ncbi:MAG: LysM peptidoglycan-binding domain-containing protein, partial [Spirochaetia bacterium]|nr:LysM peptidoglycan-binding domain-containing protein [Spirochaetia bacterium]
FSFLLLSTFLFSQSIPDQLNEARDEINRAIELGAEKNASDALKEAQRLIDEADQKFTAGDSESAVSLANSSKEAAIRAAMTSAPVYIKELKESAGEAIAELEKSGTPQEDLASSKKLYAEGESFLNNASAASASEDTTSALKAYQEAAVKFSDSYDSSETLIASNSSSEPSGSGGDDVLSLKASEIEVKIQKAREFGAESLAAEDLKAAEAALVESNTALDSGNTSEASARLAVAEEKADLALEKSLSKHAEAKKDEAEKEVASAQSVYNQKNVNNSTMQDYLNAANEALQSAKDRITERQYEESIKDSSEALNLARVLKDQIDGTQLAQNDTESTENESESVPYGGGPGAGPAASEPEQETTPVSSPEYKEYTVKNKRPSDCLWRIAAYEFHYGKGKYWKKIYEANKDKIKNPNIIHPGMVLKIPPIPGTSGFQEEPQTPSEEPQTPSEEPQTPSEEPASVEEDPSAVKDEDTSSESDQPSAETPSEDEHSPKEEGTSTNPEEDSAVTSDEDSAAPSDDEAAEDDSDTPADDETDPPEEDSSSMDETPADDEDNSGPSEDVPAEDQPSEN